MTRTYDKYPHISQSLRAMTDEGRQLVAHWHRVLTTALEGYKAHVAVEARHVGATADEKLVASMAADAAVQGWLNTMRDVAGIIVDPSEADWCCAPGMMAYPESCPQHGYDPKKEAEYPPGTVLRSVVKVGGVAERVVKVVDRSESPCPWVSVDYTVRYNWAGLVKASGWVVAGRV